MYLRSTSILTQPPDRPDHPAAPKDSARTTQAPQQPEQPQQPQQPIVPFDRFRIVHADVKSGKRIVGDVKRQVTGKISQEQHFIKTTITRVSGGWLKLTPTEALPPGEYALVEMTGKQGTLGSEGMNLYVWDFGVNPKAPANANPWKPDSPRIQNNSETRFSPEANSRFRHKAELSQAKPGFTQSQIEVECRWLSAEPQSGDNNLAQRFSAGYP